MATPPTDAPPFLAQVPVAELTAHLRTGGPDDTVPRTEVRRRTRLSRAAKRSAGVLFLGLGIMSMQTLGQETVAALSRGPSNDDAMLIAMLGLLAVAVISQALSLLRSMPGTRRIWRWVARARQRHSVPTPERPLFAQADVRVLLGRMAPESPRGAGRSSLRPAANTAGWIALTLVIMNVAVAGAGLVALSAIRSVDARGLGVGTLLRLGVAALVGYGVTAMSIGLLRSWFERRRRRLRRMLIRLMRYVLRGFDRSTAIVPRVPSGLSGAPGLLGHGALATSGITVVVAASLAIPTSPVGGTVADERDPGSTSTSIVLALDIDTQTGAGIVTTPNPTTQEAAGNVLSDPARTTTTAPSIADTTTTAPSKTTTTTTAPSKTTTTTTAPSKTTTTTTAPSKTTTTTTAPSKTTTTTTAPPKTTTTTTTPSKTTTTTTAPPKTTTTTAPPGDTTGPTVNGISDRPDPIFTTGNTPDTSRITMTTTDKSGVATVTVYYRLTGGSFAVWASLKPGTASTTFGPFAKAGTYEYRIMATDTLGNTNCKAPTTCPGGTIAVILP